MRRPFAHQVSTKVIRRRRARPAVRWLQAALTLLALQGCLATAAECAKGATIPNLGRFYSDAWGIDVRSTRFQPAGRTSINATNVARLRLKWVYGLSTQAPRSYPLVTPDTIFIGDGAQIVALDRTSGCTRWTYAGAGLRGGQVSSAILHDARGGRATLYFVERSGGVFALNAADGKLLWTHPPPGDNPIPMLSGTPLLHDGVLFVPLSSIEVVLASNPFYGCCTTSGGMAALDARTGAERWYRRTIPTLPKVTGRHFWFVAEHGPSGAPVWGAPTLDTARGTLYFGTGQNYSRPATNTSDAIFAVNAADGAVRWVRQFSIAGQFRPPAREMPTTRPAT